MSGLRISLDVVKVNYGIIPGDGKYPSEYNNTTPTNPTKPAMRSDSGQFSHCILWERPQTADDGKT